MEVSYCLHPHPPPRRLCALKPPRPWSPTHRHQPLLPLPSPCSGGASVKGNTVISLTPPNTRTSISPTKSDGRRWISNLVFIMCSSSRAAAACVCYASGSPPSMLCRDAAECEERDDERVCGMDVSSRRPDASVSVSECSPRSRPPLPRRTGCTPGCPCPP
jgi:hypothetical protein